MEHQDWETFIVHCKNPPTKDKTQTKTTKIPSNKKKQTKSSQDKKVEKLEQEGELKHKQIDEDFKRAIQKKRQELNLTQKQLAQKLSLPEAKIKEIESGKAKYDAQMIHKIKRIMKI
tara:strand:- start:10 stop:360 length:351 start_codon:yes stop_codon:yes gene_type:complete